MQLIRLESYITSLHGQSVYDESKVIPYTTSGFREPDALSNTTMADGNEEHQKLLGVSSTEEFKEQLQKEFNEMIESVKKYGGFYIGRYETGNFKDGEITTAVIKKGRTDINGVDWYYAYLSCNKIAENKFGLESHMVWGCQWDEMMNWLLSSNNEEIIKYVTDSTGKGNYGESIQPTGSTDEYAVKNIYDLAGNACEWDMECSVDWFRSVRRRMVPWNTNS